MKVLFAYLLALTIAFPAYAHPGKTDRYGGHKCLKECAEWDLYYGEYHRHDKDGKPVKVATRKPVRSRTDTTQGEEQAVKPALTPAETMPAQPVAAAAAVAVEPAIPSLPWILLMLLLLLFFVVRRNRRKASGGGSQ